MLDRILIILGAIFFTYLAYGVVVALGGGITEAIWVAFPIICGTLWLLRLRMSGWLYDKTSGIRDRFIYKTSGIRVWLRTPLWGYKRLPTIGYLLLWALAVGHLAYIYDWSNTRPPFVSFSLRDSDFLKYRGNTGLPKFTLEQSQRITPDQVNSVKIPSPTILLFVDDDRFKMAREIYSNYINSNNMVMKPYTKQSRSLACAQENHPSSTNCTVIYSLPIAAELEIEATLPDDIVEQATGGDKLLSSLFRYTQYYSSEFYQLYLRLGSDRQTNSDNIWMTFDFEYFYPSDDMTMYRMYALDASEPSIVWKLQDVPQNNLLKLINKNNLGKIYVWLDEKDVVERIDEKIQYDCTAILRRTREEANDQSLEKQGQKIVVPPDIENQLCNITNMTVRKEFDRCNSVGGSKKRLCPNMAYDLPPEIAARLNAQPLITPLAFPLDRIEDIAFAKLFLRSQGNDIAFSDDEVVLLRKLVDQIRSDYAVILGDPSAGTLAKDKKAIKSALIRQPQIYPFYKDRVFWRKKVMKEMNQQLQAIGFPQ